MAFITFSELQGIQKSETVANAIRMNERKGGRVFLSHSSKDDLYVSGVTRFLGQYGAEVYSDNGDRRLPENPSRETADILRKELLRADRLVIMVSENSAKSGWIPWELGMGDGHKGIVNVALLPMNSSSHEEGWATREYLGLYPMIRYVSVKTKGYQWVVDSNSKDPNSTITLLSKWLERKGGV